MAKRDDDNDKDQDYDPQGAHGGDTDKTAPLGDGPQAEKGDQRRDLSHHAGPSHKNDPGTRHDARKRSGSDSNASH